MFTEICKSCGGEIHHSFNYPGRCKRCAEARPAARKEAASLQVKAYEEAVDATAKKFGCSKEVAVIIILKGL